jgi:hypothetical protein
MRERRPEKEPLFAHSGDVAAGAGICSDAVDGCLETVSASELRLLREKVEVRFVGTASASELRLLLEKNDDVRFAETASASELQLWREVSICLSLLDVSSTAPP